MKIIHCQKVEIKNFQINVKINHSNNLINEYSAAILQITNSTIPQLFTKDKNPFELVDTILDSGNTGLKLCPEKHPYAYKNGRSCCGAPGFATVIKNPGIPEFFDYGNLLSLQWHYTTCKGVSIKCPGIGGGCEDSKYR